MFFGRKSTQKPQHTNGVAPGLHERSRTSRRRTETLENLARAKQLGDRAIGKELSIPGFMAIGFPLLRPDSAEYAKIVNAYHSAARLAAGSCIVVGPASDLVIGVKAEKGKSSIALNIAESETGYSVTADILCAKALYTHDATGDIPVYGDPDQPYGVTFIDSSLPNGLEPVRVIKPHEIGNPATGDIFADDGKPSWTDSYTERLLPAIPTIQT